jgi:hypothetical protein
MYLEVGPAISSGAYSIYAQAQSAAFGNPDPTMSICSEMSGCVDGTRLDFTGMVPLDGQWHQYYLAWRQGTTNVEMCSMQNDTNPADCVWHQSALPSGTRFDGVALWSGNGVRGDLGANLRFDELIPQ